MGTNIIQIDYGTWNGKYIDIYKDLMLECKKYSQYISAATPVSQTNVNARYRSKKLSSATVYFGNEDFDICKNMLRRPSRARVSVTSSENSRWPPTGMP